MQLILLKISEENRKTEMSFELSKIFLSIENLKNLGTRTTNVVVVASWAVLAPHQAVPSSVTGHQCQCPSGEACSFATVHALGGTTWPGFFIKRPNNSCRFATLEEVCNTVSRPCRSCHSFHSQNSPAASHLFAHETFLYTVDFVASRFQPGRNPDFTL